MKKVILFTLLSVILVSCKKETIENIVERNATKLFLESVSEPSKASVSDFNYILAKDSIYLVSFYGRGTDSYGAMVQQEMVFVYMVKDGKHWGYLLENELKNDLFNGIKENKRQANERIKKETDPEKIQTIRDFYVNMLQLVIITHGEDRFIEMEN